MPRQAQVVVALVVALASFLLAQSPAGSGQNRGIDIFLVAVYSYHMDAEAKAGLIKEGGRIISDLLRVLVSKPHPGSAAVIEAEHTTSEHAAEYVSTRQLIPSSGLPTSAETTTELKRRLAKELYRMELDLVAGLKIAGKPCDCGYNKHTLALEAAAEELVSQDPSNPVYLEIINWIPANRDKIVPEAIVTGQYDSEYPQMANQFKLFRKRVMGSDADTAPAVVIPAGTVKVRQEGELTLDQAKKLAAKAAESEVERRWYSREKK